MINLNKEEIDAVCEWFLWQPAGGQVVVFRELLKIALVNGDVGIWDDEAMREHGKDNPLYHTRTGSTVGAMGE